MVPMLSSVMPRPSTASGNTYLYVETRTKTGWDGLLTPGVLVHTGADADGNSSLEQDLDEATTTTDLMLNPGQSITYGNGAVTTIEAVNATPEGKALQQAWVDLDVVQCGYCQSGQIMSAAALLKSTPKPTNDDIDAAMSGNVCRCGTFQRIRAAIHRAAGGGSHG